MPRTVPVLLLALLALLAPAASASAKPELAVMDDPVLLNRAYGDAGLALDRARAMGAKRIRVNVRWARSMPAAQARAHKPPAKVKWNFSNLQRLIGDAAARGMSLQVTFTGPAPAWATPVKKVNNNLPKPHLFGRFVSQAVRATGGRVNRFSIWNEPNWWTQLHPRAKAPMHYRKLFNHGSAAIRREAPRAQVLIGELMPGANRKKSMPALQFLRAITCSRPDYRAAKRCPALVADGFAIHPYNFARAPGKARSPNPDIVEMGSLPRLVKALDRLRARGALRTRSGARMPIFITEMGYLTTGPTRVTPARHATWLTQAWNIAARNKRVRQFLQYELMDPVWGHTWNSAILTPSGGTTPAYRALKKAVTGS
jgi:hypothetical protein